MLYRAFGLNLASEILLPELMMTADEEAADVYVRISRTADEAELQMQRRAFEFRVEVQEDKVSFYAPEAGLFVVQAGRSITVKPDNAADEGLIRLYLLGTCMGIVLLQRRVCPLHGSAVAIAGKVYAIIGESGAGKSTLASAFLNKGYELVTDDVIALSAPQLMVFPAYPQQKLWQQSLDQFGMNAGRYASIYGRQTKYSIPVAERYCERSLPLGGVFELMKSDAGQVEVLPVPGIERLKLLYQHTYRQFLIPRMDLTAWHFAVTAAAAKQVNVYRLLRPSGGFTAPQLMERILDIIAMEGSA